MTSSVGVTQISKPHQIGKLQTNLELNARPLPYTDFCQTQDFNQREEERVADPATRSRTGNEKWEPQREAEN